MNWKFSRRQHPTQHHFLFCLPRHPVGNGSTLVWRLFHSVTFSSCSQITHRQTNLRIFFCNLFFVLVFYPSSMPSSLFFALSVFQQGGRRRVETGLEVLVKRRARGCAETQLYPRSTRVLLDRSRAVKGPGWKRDKDHWSGQVHECWLAEIAHGSCKLSDTWRPNPRPVLHWSEPLQVTSLPVRPEGETNFPPQSHIFTPCDQYRCHVTNWGSNVSTHDRRHSKTSPRINAADWDRQNDLAFLC
jgi:hypothetical protein